MGERYDYECYQKEQLLKEILLLENHLTTFKCMWCIKKHRTTVIALAEETLKMTPFSNETALFKQIATSKLENIKEVHDLRTKLMEILPNYCNMLVNKCSGNKCKKNIR